MILEIGLFLGGFAALVCVAFLWLTQPVEANELGNIILSKDNVVMFKSSCDTQKEVNIRLFLEAQDALDRNDVDQYLALMSQAVNMARIVLNKKQQKEAC